ncbi:peptide ABC transporter substrate-binding protein [Pseudomonas alkylphenolica]|uniref:Peptide ABC transporter substrate-binding protein n=1 Tax=Pseudomonas alkylphenolica TaxID=237609 RepID=A0A443ZXB9_9PSED|nr:FecR domain-containing protein [Pseudomonas alkylphenolica]RWU25617.1 peptide ABC transporter substrate-binding protein [Pseudomonas alkylphenolica]
MNPSPAPAQPAESDDREQQALDWFSRLRADNLNPDERRAFEHWLEAPANARTFAEVQLFWQQLQAPPRRARRAPPRTVARAWRGWAVAAAVLLIGGLVLLAQWPAVQRANSNVATAPGERRQVQLADGSRLTLDSASAVDVDLRGPVRKVRLVQGQMYIEVIRDGRPFVVDIDEAQVQVLGTRLSVSRGHDHNEVVLLKGNVEVSSNGDKRLLAAGQRLTFNGSRLDQVEKVDAERFLAWREGQLRVSEMPLREVLQKLADYQGTRLLLLDDQAGQKRVSGSFNLDQASTAFEALISSQQLKANHLAGQLIIVR